MKPMTKTAQEIIKLWLKENGQKEIIETLVGFIDRLLDNRDFLCLQLDHVYENLTDEEFENLTDPYKKKGITPKFAKDKSLGIPPDTNDEGF